MRSPADEFLCDLARDAITFCAPDQTPPEYLRAAEERLRMSGSDRVLDAAFPMRHSRGECPFPRAIT